MRDAVEFKPLTERTKLGLSGLITLIGGSGVVASSCIDHEVWSYSVLCWSSASLFTGLYCLNKNIDSEYKLKLTDLCNSLGSYFL